VSEHTRIAAHERPHFPPGARIGILGGSFNPAHEGHRHISLIALKRLRLDRIVWLVAPQNPLKPEKGMAPFAERLEKARAMARHRSILVSDLEARLGTRYTFETVSQLTTLYPTARFAWLMGADNLATFHRWKRWKSIMRHLPVAVVDRPSYGLRAKRSVAAHRFSQVRLPEHRAAALLEYRPPAWVFLHAPLHPQSATRIREGMAGNG
jgi:nicotinate-nucleotide adenylyltransferase